DTGPQHHVTASGRVVDVTVYCEGLAYNGHDARIASVVDASGRDDAEARFRSLVNQGRDVVMVANPDMDVIYASPAIADIIGYSPEEAVGRPCRDFIHPDDYDLTREHFTSALEQP